MTEKRNIEKDKNYSIKEASEILGYKSHDGIFHIIKLGYIEKKYITTLGTPRYKKRLIQGQGLIDYINKLNENT